MSASIGKASEKRVRTICSSEGLDNELSSATIAGTADFLNNYWYDGDQNLTVVQQQEQTGGNTVANKEIDYAYNAIGQFTAIGYYDQFNGPRTDIATGAFSFDTDGRLTGLAYTADAGQTAIDAYGWGYNGGSLVTSFTSNDGTASYGYDPTNQLTSATYTTNSGGHQPANVSYSFTANGNRDMAGYSTGSDNLTSSDGTYNYLYDADGNRVSRTQIAGTYSTDYKTVYTWDYRNRLADVENYDNNPGAPGLKQHVHYVFDVFDHLIATEVDPTGGGNYTKISHYVLDVSPEIPSAGVPGTATAQPALVFDGNQNLIGRNLVALDPAGVDAVMIEGTVTSTSQADVDQYNLTDNLGSLRNIVNNVSATIDRIVYNSSGQVAYESSPTNAHFAGFASGHIDYFTGLVNDHHRWCDPATGKWLSDDPLTFAAGDPNLTRYVGNDPTNLEDETGLWPTSWPQPHPDAAWVDGFSLVPTGPSSPTPCYDVTTNTHLGGALFAEVGQLGQPAPRVGGVATATPNGCLAQVTLQGRAKHFTCNTVNGDGSGGELKAGLSGYAGGVYVVAVQYTVSVYKTTAGGGTAVTLLLGGFSGTPGVTVQHPVAGQRGSDGPPGGFTTGPVTKNVLVVVPPNGAYTPVAQIQPNMGAPGAGVVTYTGQLKVVSVTPVPVTVVLPTPN